MIPYGRQDITQADIDAVAEVLKSDFLTQGPAVPAFEKGVCENVGAKHGVAVNSATSALHIACLALDLGPGDWLWTSPNTFVASANCGRYCGANVDFVDIDRRTLNMSVELLHDKLKVADQQGTLPKIVIPVHFAGEPCDMQGIRELSHQYGFRVIEDASHAIGAKYRNDHVGNCKYSDITVFSFHPVKIITTAEGGMATTNDDKLAERMSRLRTHGITRDPNAMVGESHGAWFYQQIELGYNYRMTDLQAALGLSQLSRLDEFIKKRYELAERYDTYLSDLPLTRPTRDPANRSALHLYPIQVGAPAQRNNLFNYLRGEGIGVNVHYIPVHTQPYFISQGFRQGNFPESEQYYSVAMSLPLYFGMLHKDQDYVVAALKDLLAS